MAEGGRPPHSSDDEVTSRLPMMSGPRDRSPSPSSDVELRDSVGSASRPPSSLTERGLAIVQQVGSQMQDLLNRTLGRISPNAEPVQRDERVRSEPRLPRPFFPSDEDRNRVRRNLFDVGPDDHPIIVQPRSILAQTFPRSYTLVSGDDDTQIRAQGVRPPKPQVNESVLVNKSATGRDKINPSIDAYDVGVVEHSGEHDDIYSRGIYEDPNELAMVHKPPIKVVRSAPLRSVPSYQPTITVEANKTSKPKTDQTNIKTIYSDPRAVALPEGSQTVFYGRPLMSLVPDVHESKHGRSVVDRSGIDWEYAVRVNASYTDNMCEGRPRRRYFPPLEFVNAPLNQPGQILDNYREHKPSGLACPDKGGVVPSLGGGNQQHSSAPGPPKFYKGPHLEQEGLCPPGRHRGAVDPSMGQSVIFIVAI